MNVLRRKMKRASKIKKFFYYLTILAYGATFGYFIYGILKLKGIEDLVRYVAIAFFGIWLLIYMLLGLVGVISRKSKMFVVVTILTLLFTPAFVFSSYYINKIYGTISKINSNTKTYATNLIALKDTNFNEMKIIGMVESESDIEGNQLAKKLIQKENLTNKIQTYSDYPSMISDLYKGRIGACFVTSNYAITFGNEIFSETDPTPLAEKVKVLYEYSEDMANQDNVVIENKPTRKLTEPFTILVMGVDSDKDGLKANQAFNGDTLIMVTFNPKTLTATMFSIPRDMYVPIACNHNREAKINSSAAYGSSCVISTVQKLTGISIDYYVKINFKGVVQLVDALGGVDVEVEKPDFAYDNHHVGQVCEQDSNRAEGKYLVCIKPGMQHLNGEQALAYSRCRHLYATGDIARNAHQQLVIEALAQKAKGLRSLTDAENVLNAVANNIETNMTPEQIMSFYSVAKDVFRNSSSNALSIKKTHLAYYNLPVWQGSMYTSALGYYPDSLKEITKLMRVNLGLEAETPVKTFSISFNEHYETPLVGKGVYGGAKISTLQSFIGSNRSTAGAWCEQNGITCYYETRESEEPEGVIIDQNPHAGVLTSNVKTITFYLSSGKKVEEKDEEDKEDKDKEKDKDKEENKDKDKDKDKETEGGNSQGGGSQSGGNQGGNDNKPDEPVTPDPEPEPQPGDQEAETGNE